MTTSIEPMSAGDLDGSPEVESLLARLGLGSLSSQPDVRKLPGRNTNWIGTTDMGRGVFVKRLAGPSEMTAARIRQCLAFDRMLRNGGPSGLLSPHCLGADAEAHLLVYEAVPGAKTAAELVREDELGDDLMYSVGRTVGLLHNLPSEELPQGAETTPLLPSAELLDGIPISLFEASSAAELQVWSVMQNDLPLAGALRRLLEEEQRAGLVAAHCDLRLDQFLVADGRVHLTDLEEFQAGDPARDIGGVIGDLLHRALLAAVAQEDPYADEPVSHAQMVARLTDGIRTVRPRIEIFWQGYLSERPGAGDVAGRVVAFAGWHLLDRLLAGARNAPRLAAIPRAVAGIGRKALLTPEAFISTLGLAEATR
ncbi:class IV lanthionine synthetase subunit LxmK [Streptomyces sp. ISL-43]|nr:class IV lanthionine synthetase subunit LxmK [Streptomyces sp. ISL-43]